MQFTRTSTNLLYMCRFKYILSTFFRPSIPICSLANGFLSKNPRFWARTRVPGCPRGWRRPVTLWSTIAFVPPASVPSTCSIKWMKCCQDLSVALINLCSLKCRRQFKSVQNLVWNVRRGNAVYLNYIDRTCQRRGHFPYRACQSQFFLNSACHCHVYLRHCQPESLGFKGYQDPQLHAICNMMGKFTWFLLHLITVTVQRAITRHTCACKCKCTNTYTNTKLAWKKKCKKKRILQNWKISIT